MEVTLNYNPKDDRYYLYYGEDYLADSVSMTTIMQIFGPAVEKAQESKGEALLSEVVTTARLLSSVYIVKPA